MADALGRSAKFLDAYKDLEEADAEELRTVISNGEVGALSRACWGGAWWQDASILWFRDSWPDSPTAPCPRVSSRGGRRRRAVRWTPTRRL